MSFIGTNHALLYWHADIVIVDKWIKWPTREQRCMKRIPRQWAYSLCMLTLKGSYSLKFISVPQVYLFTLGSNGNNRSWSFHPWNWCYNIIIVLSVEQLFYFSAIWIP
jgi:hypothetical protein